MTSPAVLFCDQPDLVVCQCEFEGQVMAVSFLRKRDSRVENVIMEEIGHFPRCETPVQCKKYLMLVLGRILDST